MGTDIEAVLNFRYDRWDLGECTIRHYLVELAKQCWIEGECFNGKRPFGNSGWDWDVYFALTEGGFIDGTKDEDGNWESFDETKGKEIIMACFDRLQGIVN